MKDRKKLFYRICTKYPEKHLLEVECIIPNPKKEGQLFSLPAFIPGSYLVRDFARHVVSIKASLKDQNIFIRKINKNTWQCDPIPSSLQNEPLMLAYSIYANDLTPRGAYITNEHAFLNGSRIFMQVQGFENEPCIVEILKPGFENPESENKAYETWRVATSLPTLAPSLVPALETKEHTASTFGCYTAKNYDDLIDHPIEIGNFETSTFYVQNVLHELVITHTSEVDRQKLDIPRLTEDLKKIVEHHILFFGEAAAKERFLFFLTLFKGGQGGIEHKYSCVMHASYDQMPKKPMGSKPIASIVPLGTEGVYAPRYQELLCLLSHEYFHTWHVKRIKPLAFIPYDLTQENYTKLLWLFEGITSYYDELSLVRTGLISIQSYLEALTLIVNSIYTTPGRMKQTLEESSFDAWIKFYKPDENSRNATISYYLKGALVGLCLDLLIRQKSLGKSNLDDVMRALWQRYGKSEIGLPEEGFEPLVQEVTGLNLTSFFDLAIRSTEELPLRALLQEVGIEMHWQAANALENLGGRLQLYHPIEIQLAETMSESPLERAGMMANDHIIAINQHKVTKESLIPILSEYGMGEKIEIHAFRLEELKTFSITINTEYAKTVILRLNPKASTVQKQALKAWLKQNVS